MNSAGDGISDDGYPYDSAHLLFINKIANDYDQIENALGTRVYKRLEELKIKSIVNEMRASGHNLVRVLDVGCGTGRFEMILHSLPDAEIIGIDFCEKMVKQAKRKVKAPNVIFRVACAESLPFPNETFDVVLMAFGVPSYTKKSALREAARVLKPGGISFLVPYNKEGINIASIAFPWKTSMAAKLDLSTNRMVVNGESFRCEAFTIDDFSQIIAGLGMRVVSWETFPTLAALLPENVLYSLVLSGTDNQWSSREQLEGILVGVDFHLTQHLKNRGMYIMVTAVKEEIL